MLPTSSPAHSVGHASSTNTQILHSHDMSRCCSHCGFTHSDNCEDESFKRLKCEYENNVDDATKNIGLWYLRCDQTGGDRGAPLGVRLNNRTLNLNGSYSPAQMRLK